MVAVVHRNTVAVSIVEDVLRTSYLAHGVHYFAVIVIFVGFISRSGSDGQVG